MTTQLELRVNGQWLSSLVPWGELTYSHVADGGCKAASWRIDAPLTFAHPALARGALAQVMLGSAPVWAGKITEPDVDDDWTINAVGLAELSADWMCFDGSGNTTSRPDTAIDQAIADGIPWTRPQSLSATAFASADQTDGLNRLTDLLDAWADAQGKRWGVNADQQVYAVADPSTPTWILMPGTSRLGLADDDYASDLYLRYLSTTGYATAHVFDAAAKAPGGPGYRAYPVDLTPLGLMSGTAAAVIGNGMLAKGKARLGYTNGVEVTRYQIATVGGSPACLAMVKAGDMVRQYGVQNEQPGAPMSHVNWVIGETNYEAGSETLTLTPVGLVDRNLEDIFTVTGSAA